MSKSDRHFSRAGSFIRDKRGNFGMMMGIVAFPLVGATALAIDYSMIERDKMTVQNALDAAALAASKELATGINTQAFTTYAQDYFEANLPPSINRANVKMTPTVTTTTKRDSNGIEFQEKAVKLTAEVKHKPFFAQAVGMDEIKANIEAQVAIGNLTVEIALVIDNSGSMDTNSRMTRAKSTSKDLVNQIHAAGSISNKQDPVKFSLVPFAASVNIGPNNWNQPWMDTNGWAPIHNENIDWCTYNDATQAACSATSIRSKNVTASGGRTYRIYEQRQANGTWKWLSRFDLYTIMTTQWAGCVEMRPWPHNTQDTVTTTSGSSSSFPSSASTTATAPANVDAFFVPMFGPSEPSSTYRRFSNNRWSSVTDWYNYPNDYTNDFITASGTQFAGTAANITSNQNVRQDWVFRYRNGQVARSSFSTSFGPNASCTTVPLTPMTTNKNTILNAIDQMDANGNTNVQEGIAWGWRTLSPEEPFTGGRPRTDIDNRKYLIVLTDGNNTYSTNSTPNETTYAAWGYGKHDRVESGLAVADRPNLYKTASITSWEQKMNVHTLQTCENAKAAGITIYSIAFDVADGSSVKSLLEACAGSGFDTNGSRIVNGGTFYYDVSGDGIKAAMAAIASQISEMRITK